MSVHLGTVVPPNRIFVSCVSDEFEKPRAPFPELRSNLRHYLSRAQCHMIVQEDFPQAAEDTIEKLAKLIRESAAVMHLVGELTGAVADAQAVAAYLAKEPHFLVKHPELKAELGDCQRISYTQWEAYLAIHYGVPLFVYASEKGDQIQAMHIKRLVLGRRYSERITTPADLFGKLIGDIHTIVASVPKFTREIAPSRILKHSPDELFGRDDWLDALDAAWGDPRLNVYTLVAWGGVGKTSLVAHWVSQRMAKKGWSGVERYFDWSFYSQGTGESRQTSSGQFIEAALKFFGDSEPTAGGPWERGERLATMIRRHRTLLVLDGIEPLQYPFSDPQAGRIKDQALEALLCSLAADNPGLCLVTTREHLKNIESLATTEERRLDKLSKEAAVALLQHMQIIGTDPEMEAAWEHAVGHALTLQLLGRFIVDAYPDKNICHFREVKFEVTDLMQGRSAFKVMSAYEKWLESAGPDRLCELAILRLTGLFDRPMLPGCTGALRAHPAIPGLTEALVGLKETQWNIALSRLNRADLLTVTPEAIDAHPLIREYFANRLRDTRPDAFKAAHTRLFNYLRETTPFLPVDLVGLEPLYQAVSHGCLAEMPQRAFDEVYWERIQRKTEYFPMRRLGATGTELACVSAFFSEPWRKLHDALNFEASYEILDGAAEYLHLLGRLAEALQPAEELSRISLSCNRPLDAAKGEILAAEICLSMGQIDDAHRHAREATRLTGNSDDSFGRKMSRVVLAQVNHQRGDFETARDEFLAAEKIQRFAKKGTQLVSIQGCSFCELLLDMAAVTPHEDRRKQLVAQALARAEICFDKSRPDKSYGNLLPAALSKLQIERCRLFDQTQSNEKCRQCADRIDKIIAEIRQAGAPRYQFGAYLLLAGARARAGDKNAADLALTQARQIAERGPMPLYLADMHLQRAQIFGDRAGLAEAAMLIRDLGYGRRHAELAEAEAAMSAN